MMTTAYIIEVEDKSLKRWVPYAVSQEKDWNKSLKRLRKFYPQDNFRAVKEITITEVTREIIA
jgi:hypothetical protein